MFDLLLKKGNSLPLNLSSVVFNGFPLCLYLLYSYKYCEDSCLHQWPIFFWLEKVIHEHSPMIIKTNKLRDWRLHKSPSSVVFSILSTSLLFHSRVRELQFLASPYLTLFRWFWYHFIEIITLRTHNNWSLKLLSYWMNKLVAFILLNEQTCSFI